MRLAGGRWTARAAVLALVGILVGVLVPGALAQEQADQRLVVRSVDATDPDAIAVTFAYSGARGDVDDLTVRQDGHVVDLGGSPRPLSAERPLGVALLVDVSEAMQDRGTIDRAREAALSLVASKAADDRMAVVAYDQQVTVVQDFTADPAMLRRAIGNLGGGTGAALHDGVIRTASLFRATTFQPNVLLISGGADDTASAATLEQAAGALANSGAAFHAVVLGEGGALSTSRRLADASGGTVRTTGDPAALGDLVAGIGESLQQQYVATFSGLAEVEGLSEVTLTIGSAQVTSGFTVGASLEGSQALQVAPVADPSGPAFLRSTLGLVLALGLVIVAAALAIYSLGSTFFGRDDSLDSVLRPYEESFTTSDDDEANAGSLAQTQLLQRAVEMTEHFARDRGILESIEAKLERANVPLRPPEALFFYGIGVVVLTILGFVGTGALAGAAIVAGLAILLPPTVLNVMARRRRKAFESLLPDTLQLLSSTLRAGYSLMQGVEAVSQEVTEPMGRELRRVVTEARLGRPLEESLDAVAQRMDSGDFAWAVMAIGIQREVGGNLSELLMTVAETMTERERLRRDVNALTAEGRVSAVVLGVLPLGLALFISGANPGYLEPLYTTTMGKFLMAGGAVLMLAGFGWMKKIIEIEI